MNKKIFKMLIWAAYLVIVLLPLLVMIIFPMPEGRDFWRDLSVAFGFVGLAMAGLQFIPTARLRVFSNYFDMDHVYKVHHYLSVVSVMLVFSHPLILLVNNPYTLMLLNPFTAPWRAQAGIIGLASLLLIAITSVLRTDLKLNYNTWHVIHDLLAAAIAIFALIHIFKVNYYSSTIAVKWVWGFEATIWGGMTLYMRVIKPVQMLNKPYTIKQVIEETRDTWTIVLNPREHKGFDFNPAQVAWININTSPFTIHRNPFSISGSAHCRDELRFSIKALGDFTSTIGNLKGGEIVYVDGPFGSFTLDDPRTKKGLALLAGGIGVAPIMSILHTLADAEDKRLIYLFYGSYDEENIIFYEDLEAMKQRLNLNIFYVLEKPKDKKKSRSGYITFELLDKELPKNRNQLYYFVCGPLPMIEAMETCLIKLKIPDSQITTEKYEMA